VEKRRKKIGVITTDPENIYQGKILEGIFSKAAECDYDVLVFTTFVKANHLNEGYLRSEANIYNLINFDLLDGVILLTLSFKYHSDNLIYSQIKNLLSEKCRCPVVTIDETMDDYDFVKTDDERSFESVTDHVITEHGCRNIYMLAGDGESESSRGRIKGFRRSLEKHGMVTDEAKIFYGPFWYTLGEEIAVKIAEGELEMPDAIVAASDYIGLGFIHEAVKRGIRIPEDVIVTGFDGVIESRSNEITLTSFVPPLGASGSEAVARLAEKIEGKSFSPASVLSGKLICGMSCGCKSTNAGKRERDDYGYYAPYSTTEIDMRKFLESYMNENLTATNNLDECLIQIMKHAYLVDRSVEFALCTCENWEDGDENSAELYGNTAGYTEKMKISMYRCVPEIFDEWEHGHVRPDPYNGKWFNSADMLPKIYEPKRTVPAVFYFTPVHFNGRRIGYSVIRFRIEDAVVNFIYQLWSRYVNNALEMMRVRKLLFAKSVRDSMTGLYNRNSLEGHIRSVLEKSAKNGTEVYVEFVDMNSLKYINDKFGHDAGDEAISTVAGIISSVCIDGSVCIRLGGDEFIIIGQSNNAQADTDAKTRSILERLDVYNESSDAPYTVSVSFGACCRKAETEDDIDMMIREADERMYNYKTEYKRKHNIASDR